MNRRKRIRGCIQNCLIVILILIIGFCGYKIVPQLIDGYKSDKEKDAIADIVDRNSLKKAFTQETYNSLKAENSDFIGYLKFDSELLSTPVVQAKDNDYYLRRSFYKEYNEQGIPFMDYNCTNYSQNIVIYGHNVYYDDTAMFSPLASLEKQEVFEQNQTFKLYLDGEVRSYKIVNIYEVDTSQSSFEFQRPNFTDEEDFESWYVTPRQNNLITANDTLTYADNFVTLQTCKRFYQSTRILIIAKEISRESY